MITIQETFLKVLGVIIDKGDNAVLALAFMVIIGILIYLLNDALSYKVLHKQMTVYRDRIRPVIEDAKKLYAFDLQKKLHDNELPDVNSYDFGNILSRHADLVDACFLKSERYMRERLLENHVVGPSNVECPTNNCNVCSESKCRAFRDFAKATFDSHNNVVWGEYRQRYSIKFFPLSIFEREQLFEGRKQGHFTEWCKMLAVFHQMSKDRWKLK